MVDRQPSRITSPHARRDAQIPLVAVHNPRLQPGYPPGGFKVAEVLAQVESEPVAIFRHLERVAVLVRPSVYGQFQSLDNPWGMGIVISAMAVGGVLGAYSFAPLEARFSLRTIILGSALTSSVLLFGLAFFPPVWVMALCGFAVGMAWGPMGPLLNTLVQTRCRPSVQGRVFGAQMALFASGPPLGMVLVGGMVEGLGVFLVYPILVGAVFAFALVLLVVPQLADVNRGD